MTDLSPTATAILAEVTRHGTGTSFVEVVGAARAAGIEPDGDLAICHPTDPNLIIWAGINQTVADAMTELLQARLVHYLPTTPLVYYADGAALKFPVAQRPPAGGYREPHWVPVVVNVGAEPANVPVR